MPASTAAAMKTIRNAPQLSLPSCLAILVWPSFDEKGKRSKYVGEYSAFGGGFPDMDRLHFDLVFHHEATRVTRTKSHYRTSDVWREATPN